MARTLQAIYDELATEKASLSSLNELLVDPTDGSSTLDSSQQLLADLTTPSKVAIWRLMLWVKAFGTWTLETLFDYHKVEVAALLEQRSFGLLPWYVEKAEAFQYGDNLSWVNNQYKYQVTDSSKMIVAKAAAIESGDTVIIKIAKTSSGSLAPLSAGELLAFTTYINQIKPAGINIVIINDSADLLKIAFTIYYNPLLLSSDGSLISSPSTKPVEDAINNYLQALPFNGVLNLTALIDIVQAATGVNDCLLTTAQAKYGGFSYADIVRQYTSNAGYMIIDPSFPLSSQITYTADVV